MALVLLWKKHFIQNVLWLQRKPNPNLQWCHSVAAALWVMQGAPLVHHWPAVTLLDSLWRFNKNKCAESIQQSHRHHRFILNSQNLAPTLPTMHLNHWAGSLEASLSDCMQLPLEPQKAWHYSFTFAAALPADCLHCAVYIYHIMSDDWIENASSSTF